jgi:hypothetical protein
MKTVAALLGVSLAFLVTPADLLAQDNQPPASAPIGGSTTSAANPAPFTLSQQYRYALKEAFNPARLLLMTASAAMDQARDVPRAWGGGSAAFGVRVASHLGSDLLEEHIAFGISALDHEDRRYLRLGEGSDWARTRHALRHAFIVQNERGGTMPAYSNFVADFGTPFIAQQWSPSGLRGTLLWRGGALGLGMDVAANIWREFAPDLMKRHHPKEPSNP